MWVAALLFAGVSVVVGCRAADTDGITPVPQLLAFLPWLLAPAGLGLSGGSGRRKSAAPHQRR